MYLAFAALAALALFQALYAQRFERVRAADADVINFAAAQRAFTQQMARMAALAGGDERVTQVHADLLAEALDRSRTEALIVEALLAGQSRLADASEPEIEAALADWQAARERLWYRSEALLRHLDAGNAVEVQRAAIAVQTEADPALGAADRLTETLQAAARRHSQGQLRLLEGGFALTLAVLGLLALFVVEPTAHDVKRQLRQLAEQAQQLERLALVAASTDNMVAVTGVDGRITWVNDAFVRGSGHEAAEAIGREPARLLRCDAPERGTMRGLRRALARGEGARAELRITTREGERRWVDLDMRPLGGGGTVAHGHVMVASDITERRGLQEQLARSARIDALTGLPNRAAVVERVQRALDHAARHPGYGFAVLFMDFDRFKQVNDTLGHAAGDELLRQVARRVEEALRPGDAIGRVESQLQTAARIGGDEFVVVLEGIRQVEDARLVAERLLVALSEPYLLGSQMVQSSASIGIVCLDGADGADGALASADEVLRDADTAMYEAKRAGRGRAVLFDRSMRERLMQALAIEHDLRRALRENELFAVYQPVVDLQSGAMVGVEALVRWRHPEQGVVPPGRFITVAEETGLIDAIGQQVMRSACAQFAQWRAELGALAPARLAVNLSRAQLQQPALPATVQAVLAEHRMSPAELELEVTESLAAQDERVQTTLRELKAMGVALALDDFGTGYSSLACLHLLPVDTVKIDRSFVAHAETVEYHRVLIEATIRVAQTLGMQTVAEGIETTGQATLMRRLRCDRGQGYLFARPLPAAELVAWVREIATPDTVT
ncbi:MAG: EAL domain-containing protein [Rubrivivax sp.]